MPRRARKQSPTGIYHVIMRGINRQSIFEDNEDRLKLIETLARYREMSCYRLYAYCLMDNHIHLLLQEESEPIGAALKRISSSYVAWFNKKYGRCGHLFQERFKSEVVDTDGYFLTVLRYIHQNPIKAKMVEDLSHYPWSSYGDYMNQGYRVDKDYVLNMFSGIAVESIKLFDRFSREKNAEECLEVEEKKIGMTDEKLKEIIKEQFGINALQIAIEERERQEEILKEIKQLEGVSVRQIARTTGVPQTRVWKA